LARFRFSPKLRDAKPSPPKAPAPIASTSWSDDEATPTTPGSLYGTPRSSNGDAKKALGAKAAKKKRQKERKKAAVLRAASAKPMPAIPQRAEPPSDDESSSSSAVVERPVHHPQMSASPVIPRLMFAPRSPPELPPAPPTETQDVTPVARHDAAPDPGETVSPLSLASQFRLNRRQRFWQQPESAPTPKAKQKLQPAKPVLLEKRTNFMRFGPRHTIEKASKQPRPSVVLSPKTRRTKKRDVDHFDEKAAARCWLEGLRMAEGARDLFAALVTDDPLSPPTSPACPATSPARRTAPAWKMGYANTAHELKPFFTSTPTTK